MECLVSERLLGDSIPLIGDGGRVSARGQALFGKTGPIETWFFHKDDLNLGVFLHIAGETTQTGSVVRGHYIGLAFGTVEPHAVEGLEVSVFKHLFGFTQSSVDNPLGIDLQSRKYHRP